MDNEKHTVCWSIVVFPLHLRYAGIANKVKRSGSGEFVTIETDKTNGVTEQEANTRLTNARILLQASLTEAQATVRGYATKTQIVGVGYILALSVVARVEGPIPDDETFGLLGLFIS